MGQWFARCQAVDRLFQSDAAQLMVCIGIEETLIRTVLQKRLESGQRPFSTNEELLRAIFKEEDGQKKLKAVAAAQMMVDIGMEETLIRTVLQKRLESGQSPFSTSKELLRAIFKEEEEQKKLKAVDRLFQSDAAQMMVCIGMEETLIRTVLQKRLESGQSPFSTDEELLWAIFEEEKEQKAIDRLLKSDAAQMMLDIGMEETLIRTVLLKRLRSGQSPFSTGEELLYAINNSTNDL